MITYPNSLEYAILQILVGFPSSPIKDAYRKRLNEGNLTRDENPLSHFCVYLAAHDPQTKQVFMGHHKKADLWLFNGGHIDKGEIPEATLHREMDEEWGVHIAKEIIGDPKLITITHIERSKTPCREHLDIWYFVPVSTSDFLPDNDKLDKEFHTTRWMSIAEAYSVVIDPNNLVALKWLESQKY